MRSLDVVFTKYDGSLHWHYAMWVLGQDAHGLWLGAPATTMLRKGSEPARPAKGGFVSLARAGARNLPTWNTPDSYRWSVYVDICGPVSVGSERVSAVDLDLDVVMAWDGGIELLDEDEFSQHSTDLHYPAPLVAATRGEATRIADAIGSSLPPFDGVAAPWLRGVDDLPMPPTPADALRDR